MFKVQSFLITTLTSLTAGAALTTAAFLYLNNSSLFSAGEVKVEPRDTIVQEVKQLASLTTSSYSFEVVVPTTRPITFLNHQISEDKLLYIASGKVLAGVDLSKATFQEFENGAVSVTLPAPKIQEAFIDVNQSRVYDVQLFGFSPLTSIPELQQTAQEQGLLAIKEAACNSNILDQANTRAKELLQTIPNLTVNLTPPETCQSLTPP